MPSNLWSESISVQKQLYALIGILFCAVVALPFGCCPSHIHLHIISDDLHAETLKTKKHYNSFHPRLGFFLHLDEVLSWFEEDKTEAYFKSVCFLFSSPSSL